MNNINISEIRKCLNELSDIKLQRRLWLSDGADGVDVSSFAEAVEQLFTDTGLAGLLQDGATGFEDETDAAFSALQLALRRVDARGGPARTIDDPAMTEVRAIAKYLLKLLPNPA